MELVSNETRSSLDGLFHGSFRKFLVNGKRQRQSEVKPVTFSPTLSRVNCQLPLFTSSSSDCFLGLSVCKCSLVIGQRYNFGGLALLVSLEITHNYPAQKAVVVYIQDRGFNSVADSMTKRSVNIRKWTVLFARTCAFIRQILMFDFGGPIRYQDVPERAR